MRCPRCSIEGEPINGACPNCGYRHVSESGVLRNADMTGVRPTSGTLRSQSGVLRDAGMTGVYPTSGNLRAQSGALRDGGMIDVPPTSGSLRAQSMPLRTPSVPLRSPSTPLGPVSNPSRPISLYTTKRGDILNQGRYRLIEQLVLPDNQQGQGVAWLAIDTSASQTQVVVREVVVPPQGQLNKPQLIRAVALHLSEASQHPGFPRVLDVFREGGKDFIVLQHIKGESLASILKRQGGALSEHTVAEYGRQLCEMLEVLSRQQPPMVHGAINPETVIVSPDRKRVHLIHLPFFPPKELVSTEVAAGYKAPEQARGIVDPPADLYAVAATMHHAVTGSDPHGRVPSFYPLARRLNPDVSLQMETILAQELRLSAPQRYENAADMRKDLTALLSTTSTEIEEKPTAVIGDALGMAMMDMRERTRRRSFTQMSLFAGICLVILLCLVFFIGVYPSLKSLSATHAGPTIDATATAMALSRSLLDKEWQAEAPTYQKSQVALSDGRYIFDTYAGRSPNALPYKVRAGQALNHNDLGTALSDYEKVVMLDANDGEARIYDEDLRLEMQNAPYITVVLGLPLNDDPRNLNFTRPDLQAAFVLQDQVNTRNLLPNGLKLRILIGSSGGKDSDAATIAQFIVKRVQSGNFDHIVAVVGWPTTGETSAASALLASAKIPMVSQTASGTTLDNLSSYFFRVNPNDTVQGQEQGKFAYQQLRAKKVLVLRDPTDAYSKEQAEAFISSFQRLGGSVVDNPADYFTKRTTTVEQYEQNAVQDVLSTGADLIFLPGYDQDAIRLAYALSAEANIYPSYLNKVKILGGDAIDTPLLFGHGNGPDVLLARNYPQDMLRLYFTSFSDVSEWSGVRANQPPPFFSDWTKAYGGGSSAKSPMPSNDALMTDDAFGVIVYAIKLVDGPLTGKSLRDALASIGTNQPYNGISGQIAFDTTGDPINKQVVLLEVVFDNTAGENVIKLLQTSSKLN